MFFFITDNKKKKSLQLLTHRSCFTHFSTVGGGNVPEVCLREEATTDVSVNHLIRLKKTEIGLVTLNK